MGKWGFLSTGFSSWTGSLPILWGCLDWAMCSKRANGWIPWWGGGPGCVLKLSGTTNWSLQSPLIRSDLKLAVFFWKVVPLVGFHDKAGVWDILHYCNQLGEASYCAPWLDDAADWIQHSGGATSYVLWSDEFSGYALQPVRPAGCNCNSTLEEVVIWVLWSDKLLTILCFWVRLLVGLNCQVGSPYILHCWVELETTLQLSEVTVQALWLDWATGYALQLDKVNRWTPCLHKAEGCVWLSGRAVAWSLLLGGSVGCVQPFWEDHMPDFAVGWGGKLCSMARQYHRPGSEVALCHSSGSLVTQGERLCSIFEQGCWIGSLPGWAVKCVPWLVQPMAGVQRRQNCQLSSLTRWNHQFDFSDR